jgi:threonine/homoserine/homoserine lactone efflux protein
MPSPNTILAWAIASLLITVIPGPSVLFVVSRGVALGRRAALATVVGNAMGVYVQVIAVALGLGVVLQRSQLAFEAVKLAGAAYLVFLGVRQIMRRKDVHGIEAAEPAPMPMTRIVREAIIVGISNPKAAVFFAAVLPQFVDPALGPVALQMLFLGLIFVLIAIITDGAWGWFAGSAREWLSGDARRLERLSAGGGVVLIGLGVRLAFLQRVD